MPPVTCVRCGKSLPLGAADIVGTGHRCTRCTTQVQIQGVHDGMVDVGDDFDPVLRAKLAKKARKRVRGGLVGLGLLLAPLPIGVMTGSLAALVMGVFGIYCSAWVGEVLVRAHRDARRYGARALPTATASLRPGTPVARLRTATPVAKMLPASSDGSASGR